MANVEVEGGTLSYEMRGVGPHVLMLLPQSSGPNGVRHFIAALAEHFTVITYDQRGTGGSSPAPSDMSYGGAGGRCRGADPWARVGWRVPRLSFDRVRHRPFGCSRSAGEGGQTGSRDAVDVRRPASDDNAEPAHRCRRDARPTSYARFNAALLFPPDTAAPMQRASTALAELARSVKPQDAHDIARRLDAILAFDARPDFVSDQRCRTMVITARDDQLMPDVVCARSRRRPLTVAELS